MAEKKTERLYCTACGRSRALRYYYKSNSPKYANELYKGRACFCIDCIKNIVYVNGKLSKQAFREMLRDKLDAPFFEFLYQKALNHERETVGMYIALLNTYQPAKDILKRKSSLSYADGEVEDINIVKEKDVVDFDDEEEINDFEVTKEMMKFWGKGYEKDDYEFLEYTFNEWISMYKSDTLAEQKTYKHISLKELEIRKLRERGENVDKLEDTLRKLMSDANVTPRDANAANDAENMNTLGIWIKDIERYKPAEYFKDKSIYDDYDGIRSYLERFVFRPLKNLLTGTRDFDKEFNVEDINEDIINNDIEDGDE